MLQFFQRHEINKMHETPIVSLVFFHFFHFFSLAAAAAFAASPVANGKVAAAGFTRYI
jgi:hypothetical protein